MRTSKEEWGNWTDRSLSWDRQKEISLSFKVGTTPEQMVIAAIGMAKRYNCKIMKPVEYTYDDNRTEPHKIAFTVECHKFTYKGFYEDGIGQHHNSETVTEKDVARYKDRFGTDKCIHRDFKKIFWYHDNWVGTRREFKTLEAAKKAAKKETGVSITIYTNFPYGRNSEVVCFADASGIMPP